MQRPPPQSPTPAVLVISRSSVRLCRHDGGLEGELASANQGDRRLPRAAGPQQPAGRACCTAEAGEQLGVQDPNSALQASVQVGPRIIEAAAEQEPTNGPGRRTDPTAGRRRWSGTAGSGRAASGTW